MKLHIQSNGDPKRTRVILFLEGNQPVDLSQITRAVTWHIEDKGTARVLLQVEGELSADLEGVLGLATRAELNAEEARLSMMEVPG